MAPSFVETVEFYELTGSDDINHFQKVVDLYPEKRVVIYSSETHQPYPDGIFLGIKYDAEIVTDNTLFIFHDLQDNHYTWIQNMQMYYRSINSHRDHQFCTKCLGWIRGALFHTHNCIYEFRCYDCGNNKNVRCTAELMRHRDHNVLGSKACQQCGRDMAAGKCIAEHEKWCKSKKLEWVECLVCTAKYDVNWKHET